MGGAPAQAFVPPNPCRQRICPPSRLIGEPVHIRRSNAQIDRRLCVVRVVVQTVRYMGLRCRAWCNAVVGDCGCVVRGFSQWVIDLADCVLRDRKQLNNSTSFFALVVEKIMLQIMATCCVSLVRCAVRTELSYQAASAAEPKAAKKSYL